MPKQPNMNQMMQQVQKMQADMAKAQEDLKNEVVEASAGGGMVTVKVSGDLELKSLVIDPEAVDLYFGSPSEVKQSLFDYHRSTNYSVVDMDLIEALYATSYREKVQGRERLRFLNVSRIRDVVVSTPGAPASSPYLRRLAIWV